MNTVPSQILNAVKATSEVIVPKSPLPEEVRPKSPGGVSIKSNSSEKVTTIKMEGTGMPPQQTSTVGE